MLSKDRGDFIVITKSLKDVMCLYEYGIPAIAPCSENQFLTKDQYNRLLAHYDRIYLFFDNDLPGVSNMRKLKKQFPELQCLMLNREDAKDISDYRKRFGYRKTLDLINQAKEYYGEN